MKLIDINDPKCGLKVVSGPLKDSVYLFKDQHSKIENIRPGRIQFLDGKVTAILTRDKEGKEIRFPFEAGQAFEIKGEKFEKLMRGKYRKIQFSTCSDRACFKISYDEV